MEKCTNPHLVNYETLFNDATFDSIYHFSCMVEIVRASQKWREIKPHLEHQRSPNHYHRTYICWEVGLLINGVEKVPQIRQFDTGWKPDSCLCVWWGGYHQPSKYQKPHLSNVPLQCCIKKDSHSSITTSWQPWTYLWIEAMTGFFGPVITILYCDVICVLDGNRIVHK